MDNLKLASKILTNPQEAFAQLRERPTFLFPILLILVGSIAMLFWYYSIVDVQWLMDQMLSSNPRTAAMSDAQKAQAMGRMSPMILKWSSMVGVVVVIGVVYVVTAVYYLLVGKITNVERRFSQWLAVGCWSSLPQVFGIVAALVVLAVHGNPQLPQTDLGVLSINELFTHLKMSDKGFSLFSTLTILHPWVWALNVIGVRTLSERSWAYSTAVAMIPVVLWYGGWAAIAFR